LSSAASSGSDKLEEAAVAFAREAPAQLVADVVESMIADHVDAVVGPVGMPLADDEQLEAPWACARVREPPRVPPTRIPTQALYGHDRLREGGVPLTATRVRGLWAPLRPGRRAVGLHPHQRRTEALAELAAPLAVEVFFAKASRLLRS